MLLISIFGCLTQFFKEANEINAKLQKEHETIRSKFSCNRNTPLENLTELLKNLEVSLNCLPFNTCFFRGGVKFATHHYVDVESGAFF